MTDTDKRSFFQKKISELDPGISSDELAKHLRQFRKDFIAEFKRDVSGSFMKKLAIEYGIPRPEPERNKVKRDYAYKLMNENQFYRVNRSKLRRAVERYFNESISNYFFTSIWDSWHHIPEHPEPIRNVDDMHQTPLIPDE